MLMETDTDLGCSNDITISNLAEFYMIMQFNSCKTTDDKLFIHIITHTSVTTIVSGVMKMTL